MKRIAIVGAGKIGQMIADLLGHCGDYQVAVIDKSAEQLERLKASMPVECLASTSTTRVQWPARCAVALRCSAPRRSR